MLGRLAGELWISSANLSHTLGFRLSLSDTISPSSRLTHAGLHGVLTGFWERKKSVQGLLATGSELALSFLSHSIDLGKSQGRPRDKGWGYGLQPFMERTVGKGKGEELRPFLQSIYHLRSPKFSEKAEIQIFM